jgi:D-alanine-D-alanine ligase
MNNRVAILYDRLDGPESSPDQRDVLFQAQAVAGALRELGYAPYDLPVSMDFGAFLHSLRSDPPLFTFNLMESIEGQGRLIHLAPCLLDALGIPYTGCGTDALYTTSNKLLAKRKLQGAGILTPHFYSMDDLQSPEARVKGTFIIKSVWEHASIGIGDDSVVAVKRGTRLLQEMQRRLRTLGGECFAETYIQGREFNLSLLAAHNGPEVLPPAEIRFDDYPRGKRHMVCYRAKWDEDSFEYRHTPRRFTFLPADAPLLERLKKLSRECWDLFGLRGYARVDFRVDREGRPWILEINTNPCLSPDAGFAAAADRAGITFSQMIATILQAMNRGAAERRNPIPLRRAHGMKGHRLPCFASDASTTI